MLRPWMRFLPFFVVAWFAKKHCEKYPCYLGTNGTHLRMVVRPYLDTMFVIDMDKYLNEVSESFKETIDEISKSQS